MRPPICYSCNQDFSTADGALVHFVQSDRGTAWEQRTSDDGPPPSGHHPDQGWFCPTHAGAATALANTHTIGEALHSLDTPNTETSEK